MNAVPVGRIILLKNVLWEGDSRGRGYGDICIHIADSLCYTAETNTTM